jgi:hypothetical protein
MTKQFFLTTIVLLGSALWSSANAQLPPGVGTGGRRDKSIEDKYRSDELERLRRDSNTPSYRPTTARFPEIKEDFERIQIINSDLLRVAGAAAALDYERISEGAAEITKRATRLKSNLFPSGSKEREKEVGPRSGPRDNLKFLLTALDQVILDFVHNPLFQNTKVVNPEDSSRAERELQKIINLSVRTRKKAARRTL